MSSSLSEMENNLKSLSSLHEEMKEKKDCSKQHESMMEILLLIHKLTKEHIDSKKDQEELKEKISKVTELSNKKIKELEEKNKILEDENKLLKQKLSSLSSQKHESSLLDAKKKEEKKDSSLNAEAKKKEREENFSESKENDHYKDTRKKATKKKEKVEAEGSKVVEEKKKISYKNKDQNNSKETENYYDNTAKKDNGYVENYPIKDNTKNKTNEYDYPLVDDDATYGNTTNKTNDGYVDNYPIPNEDTNNNTNNGYVESKKDFPYINSNDGYAKRNYHYGQKYNSSPKSDYNRYDNYKGNEGGNNTWENDFYGKNESDNRERRNNRKRDLSPRRGKKGRGWDNRNNNKWDRNWDNRKQDRWNNSHGNLKRRGGSRRDYGLFPHKNYIEGVEVPNKIKNQNYGNRIMIRGLKKNYTQEQVVKKLVETYGRESVVSVSHFKDGNIIFDTSSRKIALMLYNKHTNFKLSNDPQEKADYEFYILSDQYNCTPKQEKEFSIMIYDFRKGYKKDMLRKKCYFFFRRFGIIQDIHVRRTYLEDDYKDENLKVYINFGDYDAIQKSWKYMDSKPEFDRKPIRVKRFNV